MLSMGARLGVGRTQSVPEHAGAAFWRFIRGIAGCNAGAVTVLYIVMLLFPATSGPMASLRW
jgi:hypothetical protein